MGRQRKRCKMSRFLPQMNAGNRALLLDLPRQWRGKVGVVRGWLVPSARLGVWLASTVIATRSFRQEISSHFQAHLR
jgi:hypothetical protein